MKSVLSRVVGLLCHVRKALPNRSLLIAVVLLAGIPMVAHAQEATVVGTVTDPSGSAVAGAKVTLTNLETNLSKDFTTNDSGQYVAVDMHIGRYDVKVEAGGFKRAEQKGLLLQVGDRARVDFQLQIGAATETVVVEANPIAVQADSGEVSNVITGNQIENLSINGRSIYQLAALAPGASSEIDTTAPNTPVGGSAGVEYNGLRQNHNIYLLDGGEDDDRGGAGGMSIAPSPDAIAEFRTLTSNYSADYGLSSAGTNVLVLKSGSSTFHASAWEFNRNDAFDARNFFLPKTNADGSKNAVSELRVNQFGFNVGGPVTFGKLYNPDKKKTFFFYNMEWRKYINGGSINQNEPDTALYDGNFSSVSKVISVPKASQVDAGVLFQNCPGGVAPAGIVQGSPFPGNIIPSCMLSQNAQSLLTAGGKYGGIFPAPTANVSDGIGQFRGGNNSPTNLREEIVRIDHNFNSKFSIFGHYVAEQVNQNFGTTLWAWANGPAVGTQFGNPSRSGVIHTTHTISPTLLNEISFNYNGNVINIVPTGLVGAPSSFTFNRIFSGPNNDSRIPAVILSNQTGAVFNIASWPWHNKADDYQVRDDFSWTKGTHQIKIGGSWALYKKVQDLFGNTQGQFTFDGSYTGYDFSDYLLGLSNSYNELGVQDKGYWNNVSYALYVQDNWRVNKRLTLNLGLRWDGVPHTYEANNRMGNFYPSLYDKNQAAVFDSNGNICGGAFNPVTGANPGCAAASPGLGTSPNAVLAGYQFYLNGIGIPGKTPGVPKGLVDTNWAAFGPRVGFAYDLTGNGKTVVRGGFGAMYERIQGNDMYNAGPNIPFSTSVNFSGVSIDNPNTNLVTGATNVAPITVASITGLDKTDYKLPVAYQYSVGVQHSLSAKTVLGVSYVGNQSRHQNDYRNINLPDESQLPALMNNQIAGGVNTIAPFKGFGTISMANNEANAHYNGLQVDLNSQMTKDLTVRAFYTLSRSIDPSNQTNGGGGGGDLVSVSNPYAGWKYDVGPSGYDRTHIFLMNFIYDIPVFRHAQSAFVKTLLGGWQVSGIITAESGLPLNVTLTGNQGGNGIGGNNRPDSAGSIAYEHQAIVCSPNPCGQQIQYINPSAFAVPTFGAWGNLKYDAARLPHTQNWNMSLFKSFVFNEARNSRLELRLETFNTWNHTNFTGVDTGFGSGTFGRFNNAAPARILQLGAKIAF
jgi:hypothetical protein